MDRRSFLNFAAAGFAAFQSDAIQRAQAAAQSAGGRPADSLARDEDFWFQVRHAFTVDRNIINLNNGGVSPSPKVVMDTEKRYLEISNMGPAHFMWRILEPEVETVRRRLAAVLRLRSRGDRHHAQRQRSPRNRAARDSTSSRGDEVLTTNQDYPRMITTWQQRERRDGIVLKQISFPVPPPDLDDLYSRIEHAITPSTRVIHICHITNRTGQIFPVKKISQHGARARHRGDRRRRARLRPVPVQARRSRLRLLRHQPAQVAPRARRHRIPVRPQREDPENLAADGRAAESLDANIRKFEEIGTHPASQRCAITEALTFHESIGVERKAARLRYLRKRWSRRLGPLPGVKLLTSDDPEMSCGIGLISIDGFDPANSTDISGPSHESWSRPSSPAKNTGTPHHSERLHDARRDRHVLRRDGEGDPPRPARRLSDPRLSGSIRGYQSGTGRDASIRTHSMNNTIPDSSQTTPIAADLGFARDLINLPRQVNRAR